VKVHASGNWPEFFESKEQAISTRYSGKEAENGTHENVTALQ
jgi:hypothetical protein